MSRGSTSSARCLAVWLVATAGLAAAGWLACGSALTLGQAATWQRSFEDLLVAVCAAALLVCGLRLWVVTTVTTVGLVRGRSPAATSGLARRLVLVACGAAVVAGGSGPALAAPGSDHGRLAGLPLPDRATAALVHPGAAQRTAPHATPHATPATPAAAPAAAPAATPAGQRRSRPDEVVVRSGDSLWSLAAGRLPASAGPDAIDRAWRAVYAANRAEIGPDPGLIHPGQRLRLPALGEDRDR